ncbi:hypothetical protein AAG570_006336 [Ranatra chinensis]|uniref:Uncharacterized protein n=1 Tax=Ranatra chinensis TaxID=642074 RepID=A0ABD0YTS9_9HEMI
MNIFHPNLQATFRNRCIFLNIVAVDFDAPLQPGHQLLILSSNKATSESLFATVSSSSLEKRFPPKKSFSLVIRLKSEVTISMRYHKLTMDLSCGFAMESEELDDLSNRANESHIGGRGSERPQQRLTNLIAMTIFHY